MLWCRKSRETGMVGVEDDMRTARRAARELARTQRMPLAGFRCFDTSHLPGYIRGAFEMVEAVIGGRTYVLFTPVADATLSARQIDIWTRKACEKLEAHPVLAAEHMTRRMAEKLTELHVSFVMPGRHFSVRGIGRTMGARFDAPRPEESLPKAAGTLGAYAQAILLLQILRNDPEPRFPSDYARTLSITQMTALKAANELADAGFCHRERNGTPQPLEFHQSGRDLFDTALPVLASPVSHVGYLAGSARERVRPNSGEWALAQRSMLVEPQVPTYAAHRSWPLPSIASWAGMTICNAEDADLRVERWRYPPDALSSDGLADPLSLFLMFRDHPDERVDICAREMLEEFWEGRDLVRSADRPDA
jgi:hypothetical protein